MDLLSITVLGGCAAFCTTTQGTPEVVIYVISRRSTVTVFMVGPGGACWEERPYEFSHGPSDFMHQMVLWGSYVYCFYKSYSLVFKLTYLSWHPVTPGSPYPNFLKHVAIELDRKVLMVGNPEYFTSDRLACNPIHFFRMELSGDNLDWVEIKGSYEELDGRIWFINGLHPFLSRSQALGRRSASLQEKH